MRRSRRVLMVSSVLLFVATGVGGVSTVQAGTPATSLFYATAGGDQKVLSGAVINRNTSAVYATRKSVKSVRFQVSRIGGGQEPETFVDSKAPFAVPMRPSRVKPGRYLLRAYATQSDGTVSQARATFTIRGAMAAPINLRAFTGGNNIAVLWDAPPVSVNAKSFNLYRDGKLVATTKRPASATRFLYDDGTRFYDSDVEAGGTYRYQVSFTNNDGTESPKSAAVTAQQPATPVPVPTVTVDAAAAPDLAPYLQQGKATIETWYPKMAVRLALPDYQPASQISLSIKKDSEAIAYASGTSIVLQEQFVRENQDDLGVFVHEATHVLQAYKGNVPGLITEGVGDWTREQMFADRPTTAPAGGQSIKDGYGNSAFFLDWVDTKYPTADVVRAVNVAGHNGTYAETIFATKTGKSLAELEKAMNDSLTPATTAPVD